MKKTEKMLFDAVKNQNDDMASAIVNLFAAPDLEWEPDAEVPNLDLCDEAGYGLLHYAVKRGLTATINRLLQKGAAVDIQDNKGCTPLVLALHMLPVRKINDSNIFSIRDSYVFKMIELLIEHNANIHAVDPNEYGGLYTCLHLAVSHNQYLVLKALLSKQENPANCLEVINKMGATPLHLACLKGDVCMVSYMLEEIKANPNFQSPTTEFTPLHFAANGNQAKIIPLLIKAGADPSIYLSGKKRVTPLLMAQKMKNKEAAEALENSFAKLTETASSSAEKLMQDKQSFSASFQSKWTKSPIKESDILVKSFIASPIYTQEASKLETTKKICLNCSSVTILFYELPESNDWILNVLNEEKKQEKSMRFSTKESIAKIQKYLQNNAVEEFIEFLAGKGVTAKQISQYLKEETNVLDSAYNKSL
ncbi:MAG: ankyrin repeat domain-containing protein [Tatlockia sp.]